nr:MAG TPA: hypothetical protein [Caudoviricetes sp.]
MNKYGIIIIQNYSQDEGSTTIPQGSRTQVIGVRSGARPKGRRYSLIFSEN